MSLPTRRTKPKKRGLLSILLLLSLICLVTIAACFIFVNNESKMGALLTINDLLSTIPKDSYTYAFGAKDTPVALEDRILQEIYKPGRKGFGADEIWDLILAKGEERMVQSNYKDHLVTFEVGAHSAKQSLTAAQKKFHAYTIEPSPTSFDRIGGQMKGALKADSSIGEYIHLYNVAAGGESGIELDFKSTGGTGDHVGEFNAWEMKAGPPPEHWPEAKKGKIVKIPSMKLDDIVYHNKVKPTAVEGLESGANPPVIDNVWAIKVDTQGFEPQVFAGLKESIKHQKFQYVLTEYWPNGMGLLNNGMDKKCDLAVDILKTLVSAGYTIHALPVVAHPVAKQKNKEEVGNAMNRWMDRPLHDAYADCQFLLDLEKRFPNEEYHVGYWTDMLAVAPGAEVVLP